MARKARYGELELVVAKELVRSARTLQQLRQGQAVLLPALTGASIETTARILGVGRNQVSVLRRLLRSAGGPTFGDKDRRGGRHRQLMTAEQEADFFAAWAGMATDRRGSLVSSIHAALEKKVGKQVPRSTVYRLMARHGLHGPYSEARGGKALGGTAGRSGGASLPASHPRSETLPA
jgi:transposase-like protein